MKQQDFTALFQPRSIAVIGASRDKTKVGHTILSNLQRSRFAGALYPVNPRARVIRSLRAYASVDEIPSPVDLAVIAIPAPAVASALAACGRKQIRFAVVVSSGFKELAGAGAARERQLLGTARRHGIRIVGPNCLGIVNAHHRMNASFGAGFPERGSVSFVSQSGALIVSLIDWSREVGLGLNALVSIGNEADVSATELLEHLARDEKTSVIGLYMEEMDAVPEFMSVVSRISARKPIVCLKAGRSEEGRRAAASHTGSLAAPHRIVAGMLRQIGVLEVQNIEDLFNALRLFSHPQRNASADLAVVTNAGGPAIATVDALSETSVRLAKLSDTTLARIQRALPEGSVASNPIDLRGDADLKRFTAVMDVLLKDNSFGNVLVLVTPQTVTPLESLARYLGRVSASTDKHIIVSFIGGVQVSRARALLSRHGVAHFAYPHDAVRALHVSKGFFRPHVPYRGIPAAMRYTARTRQMEYSALQSLLVKNRFPLLRGAVISRRSDLSRVRRYPVALKVLASRVVHKQAAGGVQLNVTSRAEAEEQFLVWSKRFEKQGFRGMLAQPMDMQTGAELILGYAVHAQMGPSVIFGVGGVMTEAIQDISTRIAPLTEHDARDMIAEIKAQPYLAGCDTEFLARLLLRLSAFALRRPDIMELDFNPVKVFAKGGHIIDARIIVRA